MIGRSLALAIALGMAALVGCGGEPVGRICDLGTINDAGGVAPTDETVLASPSLDCVTRTCLRVPNEGTGSNASSYPAGNNGLCTAECSSDDDCDKVPESPCVSGFTCEIPVTVGVFCCKKFCVCKDYLVIPSNGIPTPTACDPTNSDNTCCNLPGRGQCIAE